MGRSRSSWVEFDQAYSFLQQSVLRGGMDSRWRADFARAAFAQGQVEEARGAMEKAGSPDAAGFLALTADPAATGWESLEAAVRKGARSATGGGEFGAAELPARMAEAALAEHAGDTGGAAQVYETILARFGQFIPAAKALSSLYLRAGAPDQLSEALRLATKAREKLPGDPEVARVLGSVCYLLGKFDQAIPLLEEANRAGILGPRGCSPWGWRW